MKELTVNDFAFIPRKGFMLYYDNYNPRFIKYTSGQRFTCDIDDALFWQEMLTRNGYNVVIKECRYDAYVDRKNFKQIKEGDLLYRLCKDSGRHRY
jgi:hypothetical protein